MLNKIVVEPGVMAANLLSKAPRVYPAIAKAARIQGTVVLQTHISNAGLIDALQVVSGPPLLQQSAIDAVKTWRYKPFLLNGIPMPVRTQVNVVFALQDKPASTLPSNPTAQPQ